MYRKGQVLQISRSSLIHADRVGRFAFNSSERRLSAGVCRSAEEVSPPKSRAFEAKAEEAYSLFDGILMFEDADTQHKGRRLSPLIAIIGSYPTRACVRDLR
jgi:hypothetical protein